MENRNFKLDTEWNMIHYSEKPNGFGILIIGDERHFVDEQKSFWTQNEGNQLLLEHLRNKGYTCFYSNLYGRHWGAKKAVSMAERLYHHIMRSEILNQKIHIIAEGMGSLVALDLMKGLEENIRSVVFINPIFSVKGKLDQEKEHRFFYKKLLNEISKAYNWEIVGLENKVKQMENEMWELPNIPIQVIHVLSGNRSYSEMEYAKKVISLWEKDDKKVISSIILQEKKQQIGYIVTNFLLQNEANL
jgi:hypothetical protein